LQAVRNLEPASFAWRHEPYEFVSDVPAIDLLTGSAAARELLESDGEPESLCEEWRREVSEFEQTLEGILLYR
jgi:hypothetical protein